MYAFFLKLLNTSHLFTLCEFVLSFFRVEKFMIVTILCFPSEFVLSFFRVEKFTIVTILYFLTPILVTVVGYRNHFLPEKVYFSLYWVLTVACRKTIYQCLARNLMQATLIIAESTKTSQSVQSRDPRKF